MSGTNSYFLDHSMSKKRHLGPQNDSRSLGPKNCQKIVNCATIKETGKLKETMVGVQEEWLGRYQYPPGSNDHKDITYKRMKLFLHKGQQ